MFEVRIGWYSVARAGNWRAWLWNPYTSFDGLTFSLGLCVLGVTFDIVAGGPVREVARCESCLMWGTPVPGGDTCGNCNQKNLRRYREVA